MKIGGMQPYFFPYIGYWQLIHAVDVFIVYDDGKMITNGWIHRNRILNTDRKTPCTISLPLKDKSVNHSILEIERTIDGRNMRKMIRAMECVYCRAPHYKEAMQLLRPLLTDEEPNMARYLTHCLQTVCDYLGITTRFVLSSSIDKTGLNHFMDKVERLGKTIGITDFINPIGGKEIYDKTEWERRGLTLSFLHRRDSIRYQQFGEKFVPDLSIIDMLMFCSVEEIRQMLNEYDLE